MPVIKPVNTLLTCVEDNTIDFFLFLTFLYQLIIIIIPIYQIKYQLYNNKILFYSKLELLQFMECVREHFASLQVKRNIKKT